jgi:hypothetical protein
MNHESRPGQAARGKDQIDWEEDRLHLITASQAPSSTNGHSHQHTPEQHRALHIARQLARAGVPIFTAEPTTVNELGFLLPTKWEQTRPNVHHLEYWRPGMALCAVGGVLCDFIDIDPRNGGDKGVEDANEAGGFPQSYGRASTPSGGTHDMVAPLGIGKPKKMGIDLQGGKPDGSSRGFVFIAPTARPSKVTGEWLPYRWLIEPDLDMLMAHRSARRPTGSCDITGAYFAEWITKKEAGADFTTPRIGPGQPSPGQLEGILRKVAGAINGERNSLLYWGACRLTENSYPKEAFNALYLAGVHTGLSDREVVKTIRSANQALGGAL